jgi:DNA-binding NtrC family response regulator
MAKRILVVDDEKGSAFLLGENLTELGPEYVVETASSGEEALEKIHAAPFDLVITDFRMPGIDGLQLIQEIRTTHPDTRSILITAYGSPNIKKRADRLGVYRYMTKPFLIEELLDSAREALEGRGQGA